MSGYYFPNVDPAKNHQGVKTPQDVLRPRDGYKSSKNIDSGSYSAFPDTGSILSKTQRRYFKAFKESMESIPPAYV